MSQTELEVWEIRQVDHFLLAQDCEILENYNICWLTLQGCSSLKVRRSV